MDTTAKQIHQLLRTDPDCAFRLLYQHYYRQLCTYVLRFVDNADEAQDIIQNMFVYLWGKREQLSDVVNIKAYLYRSARNASLNSLRSRKESESLSDLDLELLDLACVAEPESAKFDSVAQAIDALPPQCKRIFELNRLEGYSYKEIANQLNISHRTVDAHLNSAMRSLRDKLNPVVMPIIVLFISMF